MFITTYVSQRVSWNDTKRPDLRGPLTHVLTHYFAPHFSHNSRMFSHRRGVETPAPAARFYPARPRSARPGQTGTRLPCAAVCPLRLASPPPATRSIDPYTKERKVLSADRGAPRVWLADGQSRLHLCPARLWDGQKSLIPSTRCVVGDLKFSRARRRRRHAHSPRAGAWYPQRSARVDRLG